MLKKAENYRYLISEIELINNEINELTAKYPDPALKTELDELLSSLEERKEKCLKESKEFEELIISVPDVLLRKALFLRYVNGLTWSEIGREQRIPSDTVKARCLRYLKKHSNE